MKIKFEVEAEDVNLLLHALGRRADALWSVGASEAATKIGNLRVLIIATRDAQIETARKDAET